VAEATARRPLFVANCSGFYGDRLAAAREVLEGDVPVDVLTGDYLAELTMLLLWKARQRDPSTGFATTFLRQMEDVLGLCLERGVRVVANAGGLNPRGLAERLVELGDSLGLSPRVAFIEGDDLSGRLAELQATGHPFLHVDTGHALADRHVTPLTANAYLGGWGIAEALGAGADVVVCPRVTDAALVVGPAAWWHGWSPGDWDRLAGAVVVGHILECGTQATGGNYSLAHELPDHRRPGFPIAEVAADASAVITKQPGSGGTVTVGTVTAQLLYEIAEPAYINPDVVTRFDTIALEQVGPDRVAVSGVRGEPAPDRLKVAINFDGGYRNSMTMVLTGLDIEAKAAQATDELFEVLGGPAQFDKVDVRLVRSDRPDAPTNEQATAQLRVTVEDRDPAKVGRRFSGAVVELLLASYAGAFTTTPPTDAHAFGVYWPTLIPADLVAQVVTLPDGSLRTVPEPPGAGASLATPIVPPAFGLPTPDGATERVALGELCGARSGDKGGNANVGLWTWDEEAYAWLVEELTPGRFTELVGEAVGLPVHRYLLPNLLALNFVVVGLLGEGVASSARADPQAKGLGEYLRSRLLDAPASVVRRARRPAVAGPAGPPGGVR